MKKQAPHPDLPVRFDRLREMTDDFGLFQHGRLSKPDPDHGYCVDDNARGLVVCAEYYDLAGDENILDLVEIYLRFLEKAQCRDGRFHNFADIEQQWLDDVGSEDCQGRAIFAAAAGSVSNLPEAMRKRSRKLFDAARHLVDSFRYLRSHAEYLLAAARLAEKKALSRRGGIDESAGRFVSSWKQYSRPGWRWFEPMMTYANARLPHALIAAYQVRQQPRWLEIALESLEFLIEQTVRDNIYVPIGNAGWHALGRDRISEFDQQPIETDTMVALLVDVVCLLNTETGLESLAPRNVRQYAELARMCHEWFLGRNRVGQAVAQPDVGGCYDGITPRGPNENQGAESILAFLSSSLACHNLPIR